MEYKTYQQERAERDAEKANRKYVRKYVFVPVFMDRGCKHLSGLRPGDLVIKTQPSGCPRNGTMGQCYIADGNTGEFIGMVCVNSLVTRKEYAKR